MTSVTPDLVRAELSRISLPDGSGNIVEAGLVDDILISDGKVIFSLTVPADQAKTLEPVRKAAEAAAMAMEGVTKVTAVMTAERKAGEASVNPPSGTRQASPPQSGPRKTDLPGVGAIIAVASGKGGVGKSTTAVNLALALARQGKRIGLLDADIYGPSIPRMLGVNQRPTANGRILDPIEKHGVKLMSIGFLVEEDSPMIWRGPMVISALTQMLREVDWGTLDILVVDMPPGTGDAQLTMAQQVPLAGAVIVSTPQDIALIDARKGLNMFRKVEVPILGLIENMSTFICPKCGARSDIFGHGGARDEAEKLGMPFLGEVPLHMTIRARSDAGEPVVVSEPDGDHARCYLDIAGRVSDNLDKVAGSKTMPNIVFE